MKFPTVAFAAGLALVCALPFALKPLRGGGADRCALDGVAIDPRYAVRLSDEPTGVSRRFCCPTCAEVWIARDPATRRSAFVTDESTGAEIDARDAWFVRSRVVAVPATDSRVHSFAIEAAAKRHADEFRGTLLEGDERPLRAINRGATTR
jgi:hypothetical protein